MVSCDVNLLLFCRICHRANIARLLLSCLTGTLLGNAVLPVNGVNSDSRALEDWMTSFAPDRVQWKDLLSEALTKTWL
jgi:hypothetical protein